MPPVFLLIGQSLMKLCHDRLTQRLTALYPGALVLPYAVGGTLIDRDWQKGKGAYDIAISAFQAAQASGYGPAAVLFYQGQSDALTAYLSTAEQWQAKFLQMVSDIREDMNAPDLPFIYGILGEPPSPPPTASQYGGWNTIRAQQVNMPVLPHIVRVSTWGCGPYVNSKPYCHLPASGLDVLADRFANWTKVSIAV